MDILEKIKHIDLCRSKIEQLQKDQEIIYGEMMKLIKRDDEFEDLIWDYVFNGGGEWKKNLIVNKLRLEENE